MREIVRIKQALKYFQENKFWIVGVLYVSSIIKEVIWFSVFGINILNFSSIQDTFISFFNHTIIFIIIYVNYLFFILFESLLKKSNFLGIIFFIVFLIFSFVYFQLLKKPFSILFIIFIVYAIDNYLQKRQYLNTLKFSLILLIGFSTFVPLIQATRIKETLYSKKRITQFEWNESNMDYYSFIYEGKLIDTKQKKYFLIGSNREYFFVFDKSIEKSLIIPKSDCKNIIAKFNFF
jgi:hypothetical protein